MSSPIEDAIFAALAEVEPGKTVSPEAVARAVDAENWRRILPQVRAKLSASSAFARLSLVGVVALHHGVGACQSPPSAFTSRTLAVMRRVWMSTAASRAASAAFSVETTSK